MKMVKMDRLVWVGALLLSAVFVSVMISPFTFNDSIYTRKVANADSLFLVLMVEHGTDRLLNNPADYYSAPFLYPDPTAMRLSSTYLTHSLMALPFKLFSPGHPYLLGEIARFLAVFISFISTCYLLIKLGISRYPALLITIILLLIMLNAASIDRYQSLSFGWLAIAMICVLVIVDREKSPWYLYLALGSSLFLLVHASVYMVVALMAIFPVFLPLLFQLRAIPNLKNKIFTALSTLFITGGLIVLSLLPWLQRRWDLGAFATKEFVNIKRWYEAKPHQFFFGMPEFQKSIFSPSALDNGAFPGWGIIILAIVALVTAMTAASRNKHTAISGQKMLIRKLDAVRNIIFAVWTIAFCGSYFFAKSDFPAVLINDSLLFIGVVFWILSLCFAKTTDWKKEDWQKFAGSLLLLAGVILILFSLGNRIEAADGATVISNGVFSWCATIFPPVNQFRFLYRLTSFGFWFAGLGISLLVYSSLRIFPGKVRMVVFSAITILSVMPWLQSEFSPSSFGEMPEGYAMLKESEGKGGLLELPVTKWTHPLAMDRMHWQRQHGRPIVDGVNSIAPPWFTLATEVFNTFPSLESRLLMAQWQIDTVIVDSGLYVMDGSVDIPAGEVAGKKEKSGYLLLDINYRDKKEVDAVFRERVLSGGEMAARISDEGLNISLSDGNTFYETAPLFNEKIYPQFIIEKGETLTGLKLDYGFGIGLKIPSRVIVEAWKDGNWLDVTKGQTGRFIKSRIADKLLNQKPGIVWVEVEAEGLKEFRVRSSRANWQLPELRLILK